MIYKAKEILAVAGWAYSYFNRYRTQCALML